MAAGSLGFMLPDLYPGSLYGWGTTKDLTLVSSQDQQTLIDDEDTAQMADGADPTVNQEKHGRIIWALAFAAILIILLNIRF